jgi:Ni,Fe-hydrogenase I small subunit
MANVLWLQGGACSGNTMSFLCAEEPTAVDLVTDFGINVLWHPSLGFELGEQAKQICMDCATGKTPLDLFVFEGTVILGPNGTGRFNMFADRPMKDWVRELAAQAGAVVALGDCACWGGIPATEPNPVDNVGLQYLKRETTAVSWARISSPSGDCRWSTSRDAPRIRTGSRRSWWPSRPVAPATSHSTSCSAR